MLRLYKKAAIVLCVGTVAWAQQQRPRIDVTKYTIDADINPRTQSLMATAKIDFTPLDAVSEVDFELNNALTVSKVVDAQNQPVGSGRSGQDFSVKCTLPTSAQKGQATSISFTYGGKLTGDEDSPINGIKFAALHPEYGYLLYPARWFPVSGYTTDRFMADLRITVPPDYKVVASGDVKSDRAANGGTTFSFHYDKASFPGSIAIVKGDGVRVSSQGITSNVYFRDQQAADAQAYGDETGKIMTVFTSEYGLAPQANLSIVETEAGAVNGYAAPGIIFLAPSAITKQVNTRVLSNQLSRQWFGVLVSPANRNHLWLVNGGARY